MRSFSLVIQGLITDLNLVQVRGRHLDPLNNVSCQITRGSFDTLFGLKNITLWFGVWLNVVMRGLTP